MEKVSTTTQKTKAAPSDTKQTKDAKQPSEKSFAKVFHRKGEDLSMHDSKKDINKQLRKDIILGEDTEKKEKGKEGSEEKLDGFMIPRLISEKSGAEGIKESIKVGEAKVKLDENLINRIVESARIVRKGDTASMEINIKSDVFENLKLIVTAEGNAVKTEFITDNPMLKGLIKDSMVDLEQSLVARGLEVLDIVVRDEPPKSESQKQYDEYRRINEQK